MRLRRVGETPRLVWGAMRFVWQAGRGQLLVTMGLQFLMAAALALQVFLGTRVLGNLLAVTANRGNAARLIPELLALLVVTAVSQFAAAAQSGYQRLLSDRVLRHAQDRIIDVATAVDLEAFDDPTFHDRLQRASTSAASRPLMVTQSVIRLSSATVMVVGLLVVLLTLVPLVVFLVLLASLPAWVASAKNSEAYFRFGRALTPNDRQRQHLNTALTGREYAKEVRAFELAGFLRRRYDRLWDERLAVLKDVVRKRMRRTFIACVCDSLFMALAIGLLITLVLSHRIALAAGLGAAAAVQQLASRLRSNAVTSAGLYESLLFVDDLNSFLALAPAAISRRASAPAPPRFSRLVLDKVSFSYPQGMQPALEDVSLEIRAGEVVALVGENGSGKTTLAKLLCQLYRPTEGRILWDGIDVAAYSPEGLRQHFAILFQDFAHYVLTAAENIAVGRHELEADRERVLTAGKAAGAQDFLAALPEGYDTMLGRYFEGGQELSVGQWQRVALARAYFRGAPFVILDEPTAALDARAERQLFEQMRAMAKGRTMLLISHRFSSVRSADRIYVLSQGRVVEQGRHEELMRNSGLYAELFNLQAASYLSAADGDGQIRADTLAAAR